MKDATKIAAQAYYTARAHFDALGQTNRPCAQDDLIELDLAYRRAWNAVLKARQTYDKALDTEITEAEAF